MVFFPLLCALVANVLVGTTVSGSTDDTSFVDLLGAPRHFSQLAVLLYLATYPLRYLSLLLDLAQLVRCLIDKRHSRLGLTEGWILILTSWTIH